MNRRGFIKGIAGAVVTLSTVPVIGFVLNATGMTARADRTLSEIAARTLLQRRILMSENISSHNALIDRLKKKGPL